VGEQPLPRVHSATTNNHPKQSKEKQVKESHDIVHAMAISSRAHLGGGPSLAAEVGMADGTRDPTVACAASPRIP
jgi:hypothetical protein